MLTLHALGLALSVFLAQPPDAACATTPTTVQPDERFVDVVEELLEASPAFALQCGRVSRGALVAIQTLPRGEESCCRARATLRRYGSGTLVVVIELPALRTRAEYAELLGHEFEHIVEQLEGVDMERLGSRLAGDGSTRHATYETDRAQAAGRAIAAEARCAGW